MKSILKQAVNAVALLFFLSVFLGVLRDSLMKNMMVLPVLALMALGYWLLIRKDVGKRSFYGCFLMMILIQLVLGYYLMVEYATWDVYSVTKNARALVTGEWFNSSYFARYPNNLAILLFFTGVFKVTNFLFGSTSNAYLVVLNIIAIDVAVLLAVKLMKRLYRESTAYRAGIILTLFAPLYLYVPICYTDTFSMPVVLGIACWIVSLTQDWQKTGRVKKALSCAGIGATLLLGYQLKGSVAVILIAAVMYLFFRYRFRTFLKGVCCMMAGFILAAAVWSGCLDSLGLVTEEEYEQHQFPFTHWIMMGLTGTGNFKAEEVNYTLSFETYEEKQEATVEKIKQTVGEIGIGGVVRQFYSKAVTYAWNYGTCFAERYLGDYGDQPVRPGILHEWVLTKGEYHDIVYVYTQSMWLLLFGFAAWGFVKGGRGDPDEMLLLRLMLVGCMMFFMMWETHPRYVLNYTPVMVLIAVGQMEQTAGWIAQRKQEKRKKKDE